MNKPVPSTLTKRERAALDRHVALDLRIEKALESWEKLAPRYPVHYWLAINVCIREQYQFPDWVMAYLGQCAQRVLSDRTKQTKNERKTLRWILGFPKKGMGSKKPLDPRDEIFLGARRHAFAKVFVKHLDRGEDPAEARGNAGLAIFDEVEDDRTLRKYLREEFQVRKLPRTIKEWEPVVDRYLNNVRAKKRTHFTDDR
jgi:hypothetical protein